MNKILWTTINFLIVIGIIFVLIAPKFNVLKELNSKIDLRKTEIQTQAHYFKNLENISKELLDASDEVAKVNSALPETMSVHSLISFLQKACSDSGLILKQINFGGVSTLKENQKINSLPIVLEVAGSYSGFKNFILKLEKSARIIEVENTSFSYPTKAEKGGYTFRLGIKVYSY